MKPCSKQEEASTVQMPSVRVLGPTPSYLAIAKSPSVQIEAPNMYAKKLIILDLNGTLLLRPKPRNMERRPILPRPYMPTFRSFLFHDEVKRWLDVMVWSSAQPHNVTAMVLQCFRTRRHELKAVWARDTLGLTKEDYSNKVQTMKDLQKPWTKLSDVSTTHSAETTLLIDDSVLKAQLQPFNHLCISEYTQNLRNRDLEYMKKRKEIRDVTNKASSPDGFDFTLIAIIGVLDEIKKQTNVAGWLHSGGLWAGFTPPAEQESFNLFSDDEAEKQRAVESQKDPSILNPGNDAVLGGSEVMWFEYECCFKYWVDRGIVAIQRLGLKLDHGMH